MKKGISPLVTTVLIIAFVITLATVIILFGQKFVEKSTQRVDVQTDDQTICLQDVNFDIIAACYLNPSRLKVVILNDGKKDIRTLITRLYESSNDVFNVKKDAVIRAGESGPIEFNVESADLKQIEMIPIVRHRFKSLTCSNNMDYYGDYLDDKFGACTS